MRTPSSLSRFLRLRPTAIFLSIVCSVGEYSSVTITRDEAAFVNVRELLFEYLTYVLTVGLTGTVLIILCAMAVSGLLQFNKLFPNSNQG